MNILIVILLSAFGVLVLLFCAAVLVAYVRSRRIEKMASEPAPPFLCPACGSDHLDIHSSGLWDGVDEKGRSIGGSMQIATCKQCSVHAQRASFFDNDLKEWRYETRKMSEEEWQQ